VISVRKLRLCSMWYVKNTCNISSKAMPWLRQLVSGLSPQRPMFVPRSLHVRFVVDRVALGQVFLQVFWFSPVIIIPPWLSVLMYHLGYEQACWRLQFRVIGSPH
jgi:hypothetical protein